MKIQKSSRVEKRNFWEAIRDGISRHPILRTLKIKLFIPVLSLI